MTPDQLTEKARLVAMGLDAEIAEYTVRDPRYGVAGRKLEIDPASALTPRDVDAINDGADLRLPDARPAVYCLIFGVGPDGDPADPGLVLIRLPWRPGEHEDFRVAWEEFCGNNDAPRPEDAIENEDQLLMFLDDADTDEVDWALVAFDVSGPRTIRERSAYYRPPLAEAEVGERRERRGR